MVMSPDHLDLSSMLTEFERPLNESERERLLASLPRKEVVEDGMVSELLGLPGLSPGSAAVIGVITFVVVMRYWNWMVALLVATFFAMFVTFPAYFSAQRRKREQPRDLRHERATRAILAAQKVQVTRVESEAVVELICDGVTIYLFDIGDQRMFWHGIENGDATDGQRWPNSCFEIVQVPASAELFGPFCEGRRLELREQVDRVVLDLPDDGIVEMSLDGFLREVQNRRAKKGTQDEFPKR